MAAIDAVITHTQAMKGVTIKFTITRTREDRLRMCVALFLMRVGARVLGVGRTRIVVE